MLFQLTMLPMILSIPIVAIRITNQLELFRLLHPVLHFWIATKKFDVWTDPSDDNYHPQNNYWYESHHGISVSVKISQISWECLIVIVVIVTWLSCLSSQTRNRMKRTTSTIKLDWSKIPTFWIFFLQENNQTIKTKRSYGLLQYYTLFWSLTSTHMINWKKKSSYSRVFCSSKYKYRYFYSRKRYFCGRFV